DHHTAFFEVTNRAAADVGFSHGAHLDSREHTGHDTDPLQGVHQRHGIHNGAKHAHVIRRCTVHAAFQSLLAAPEIAGTNHHGNFGPHVCNFFYPAGNGLCLIDIDAKTRFTRQCLPAELEKNPLVLDVATHKSPLSHRSRMRSQKNDQPVGWSFFHLDRKSTRLNSSHVKISYAVFCLKKKKNNR